MATNEQAGVDPAGLRNTIGIQINPATEESVASLVSNSTAFAGLVIPKSDSVYATYPTTSTEVYTYKLLGSTVAIVTVTYETSAKVQFVSITIA